MMDARLRVFCGECKRELVATQGVNCVGWSICVEPCAVCLANKKFDQDEAYNAGFEMGCLEGPAKVEAIAPERIEP